mgnify:CR=1 FL=1|jgi:hypothetical protein
MYLPDDLWNLIKQYLFHNIKIHGKHLKKNPYIVSYNNVMNDIPKPIIPKNGPKIMYSSKKNTLQFVKFIYYVPHYKCLRNVYTHHRILIETHIFPDAFLKQFKDSYYNDMDIFLRDVYHTQYNT